MLERPLQGVLRSHGEAGESRFEVILAGQTALYRFPEHRLEVLLEWDEREARLRRGWEGEWHTLEGPELARRVVGSAVTYEDLTLHFLYWQRATLMGEEALRTRRCWKIRVDPPSRDATFGAVILWIDQQSRALMRADAYDWEGRLAKRFEVVAGQRLEGNWFLRRLRIEEFDADSGRPTARSYLEIEGFSEETD